MHIIHKLLYDNLTQSVYLVGHSIYDNMWGLVMKAVPKLDESESGQMVLSDMGI